MDNSLPDLSRDTLVELAGWSVLKEARAIAKANAVHNVTWNHPLLTAEVRLGTAIFRPRLNLKSLTFAQNLCSCTTGRRGQICSHAIAACILADQVANNPPLPEVPLPPTDETADSSPSEPEPPIIKSLRLNSSGIPLRLRILLPPNIDKTAPRDAIMVKLELATGREIVAPEQLFRGRDYTLPGGHFNAYALLEKLCNGKPSTLLQLKRRQLSDLLDCLKGEPFIYFVNQPGKPLEWENDQLPAIYPLLVVPPSEKPTPINVPKRKIQVPDKIKVRRDRSVNPPKQQHIQLKSPAVEAIKERIRQEGIPGTRVIVDGSSKFIAITPPSRDLPSYQHVIQLLRAHEFRNEPSNGRWWLRDRHRTLNFLAAHEATLKVELDAFFTENFRERTASIGRIGVELETVKKNDDYVLTLKLAAPGVETQDLYRALASGQNYIDTGKQIFLFDPTKLEQFERAQKKLSGNKDRPLTPLFEARISSAQLLDTENILDEFDESFTLPVDWTSRSGALKRIDRLETPPLHPDLDKTLRNYQRIGVAWLWHLYQNKLGGILADEMGLGKTIQALGLIQCIYRKTLKKEPTLVVCPASLIGNWKREASRFTPELSVFVHHRDTRLTESVQADSYNVILTTYQTLTRDEDILNHVDWNLIIADEAQHIKNRRTQSAKALRCIQAHARFVLTGTPIENSLDDLRSIFAFLLPGYLNQLPKGSSGEERNWFDQRHRSQAAPYILRRTKKLVAPELPDKIEQIVYCDFSPQQKTFYEAVRLKSEKAIFDMEVAGENEGQLRFAALTQLLRLRQVCADPRMLDPEFPATQSTKLAAFQEILNEALDDGHRILVFSQFVKLLGQLKTHLDNQGVRFIYIDGKVKDRLKVCDTFNNDNNITVCLISLKAGGVGLNLTGADTVVHFDPWWNPAVEDQATDRAHRIGQNRTVTSYKLIAANTVEEKVLELQRTKADLLRDLLDESAASTAKVSLADIKAMLKGE